MFWKLSFIHILIFILTFVSCDLKREKKGRRRGDFAEKAQWKKEFEEELTNAMLSNISSKKRHNATRRLDAFSDNENVIEKFLESITVSEKYLKKIEDIDFRLNRLDVEYHEKTNDIMKQLEEIIKTVRRDPSVDRVEAVLESVKTDVSQVKQLLDKIPEHADGPDYHPDAAMDARLRALEGNVKNIVVGVDAIVSTIAEVKSRQYSKASYNKPDGGYAAETINLINEFRRTMYEQKLKKCDCKNGRVDRSERYPTDCYEIQMQGFNISGIYKIKPDDMEPFYVLCDLTTAGGGWTVFQNRFDGSQDFYKGWSDYKHGFGNLAGEFWLGLEKLSFLTNQKLYELRIEMETQFGQEAYVGYSVFTVGQEHEGYRISTLGTFYGPAGDSLSYHAGQKFSTLDVDNDEWKDGACALEHGGAWWYKECDKSNLNGKYSNENRGQSIYWISFKGPNTSLSKSKMMIRPLPASKPLDFTDTNRKNLEVSKLRHGKLQGVRKKDIKAYELNRDYRYGEPRATRTEVYFPNYG